MSAPPDSAARKAAQRPEKSYLIRAPAGSGKTTLLVARFLRLLASVKRPEEILAITFTRKATAEMRERIIGALQKAEHDIAIQALENSRRHGWDLLRQTRRLQIKTIDGFCSELVRRMPWASQFGAPPGLIEQPEILYRRAAAQTLSHLDQPESPWHNACAELLELVEADLPRAQRLIAGMLADRDQWLPKIGGGIPPREQLGREWAEHISNRLSTTCTALTPFAADLTPLLKHAAQYSEDEAHHCLEGFPGPNPAQLSQWRALAALLTTTTGTIRKTVNKRQGFAPQSAPKQAMLSLLGALAAEPGLDARLHLLRQLPDPEWRDSEWAQLRALCALLPLAAAELQLLFRDTCQADYCEIALRAGDALGSDEQPTDLALAYDYRIQHLLVDEFQDTTRSQINLIERLIRGWQADDGRSIFLVGDPQQSIYLFRQAEVSNFLQVGERGLAGMPLTLLNLTSNFRSTPELIDWQNRIFREVLGPHSDSASGRIAHAPSTPGKPGSADVAGVIAFHHHFDKSPEERHSLVADLVEQELKAMDASQTIAVLGQVRRHLHGIAAELRVRGIPFAGLDLEPLGGTPHIRDCLHLTCALQSPADRSAWLSVLRAPWCGLSWQALTQLAGADWDTPLPEQIARPPADLPDADRKRLTRIQPILAAALQRQGRVPIAENVEAAWLALGGLALCAAAARADCQRYFALLAEQDARNAALDMQGLEEALSQLWSSGAGEARVQLLTMHRAKGLEFASVIIPRLLHRRPASAPRLLNHINLPGAFLLAGLPPRSANTDYDKHAYLNILHTEQEHSELRRLLYVACTRARCRLHLVAELSSEDPKPVKNTFQELLWEPIEATAQFPEQAAADLPPETLGEHQIERLPDNWQPPPWPDDWEGLPAPEQAPEPVEFNWASEPARRAGEVLHAELQTIGADGWETWRNQPVDPPRRQNWERQLREHGLLEEELHRALDVLVRGVERIREDPKAAWIFSPDHQDIHCEWALSGQLDGGIVEVRIDRSFIADGQRWVVDFKSSSHEGGALEKFLDEEQVRYSKPMNRYARLIEGLEEGKPVCLALYYPLLGGWRRLGRKGEG